MGTNRKFFAIAAMLVLCSSAALYAGFFTICTESVHGLNGGYSPILSGWSRTTASDGTPPVGNNLRARTEIWIDGMNASQLNCSIGAKSGTACVQTGPLDSFTEATAQADYNRGTGIYSFGAFNVRTNEFWIDPAGVYHQSTADGPNTHTHVYYVDYPPRHNPQQCPADGPYWCGASPILIPLLLAPVRLSEPEVTFDIDGDGTTESVSWPVNGNTVAFLVYDKNGNGIVDDGSELLGNHFSPNAGNGFEAIQELLTKAGQPKSGEILESNPVFAKLLLWNDRNRNGYSDPGELRPASDLLHGIGLGYETSNRADLHGNEYRFKGWAEFKVGNTGATIQRPVFDVFFVTQ